MNKLIISIIVCVFTVLPSVHSQGCGTKFNREFYEATKARIEKKSNVVFPDKINRNIDIVVYIVGQSMGIQSALQTNLDDMVNKYFAPIAVKFNLCSINYIKNTSYLSIDSVDIENEMTTKFHTPNTINLYVVENIPNACGYSYLPGSPKNIIVIRKSCIAGRTLTHELGHFFGLFHPHQDDEDEENDAEFVNGFECDIRGDLICDTPADPDLSTGGLVNDSCNYVGNLQDENGDYYVPMVSNLMGYAISCSCRLTNGQYKRMVETYFLNLTQLKGAAYFP